MVRVPDVPGQELLMRINPDTRHAISWHGVADRQWMTSKHIGEHRDHFIAAFRNVRQANVPGRLNGPSTSAMVCSTTVPSMIGGTGSRS